MAATSSQQPPNPSTVKQRFKNIAEAWHLSAYDECIPRSNFIQQQLDAMHNLFDQHDGFDVRAVLVPTILMRAEHLSTWATRLRQRKHHVTLYDRHPIHPSPLDSVVNHLVRTMESDVPPTSDDKEHLRNIVLLSIAHSLYVTTEAYESDEEAKFIHGHMALAIDCVNKSSALAVHFPPGQWPPMRAYQHVIKTTQASDDKTPLSQHLLRLIAALGDICDFDATINAITRISTASNDEDQPQKPRTLDWWFGFIKHLMPPSMGWNAWHDAVNDLPDKAYDEAMGDCVHFVRELYPSLTCGRVNALPPIFKLHNIIAASALTLAYTMAWSSDNSSSNDAEDKQSSIATWSLFTVVPPLTCDALAIEVSKQVMSSSEGEGEDVLQNPDGSFKSVDEIMKYGEDPSMTDKSIGKAQEVVSGAVSEYERIIKIHRTDFFQRASALLLSLSVIVDPDSPCGGCTSVSDVLKGVRMSEDKNRINKLTNLWVTIFRRIFYPLRNMHSYLLLVQEVVDLMIAGEPMLVGDVQFDPCDYLLHGMDQEIGVAQPPIELFNQLPPFPSELEKIDIAGKVKYMTDLCDADTQSAKTIYNRLIKDGITNLQSPGMADVRRWLVDETNGACRRTIVLLEDLIRCTIAAIRYQQYMSATVMTKLQEEMQKPEYNDATMTIGSVRALVTKLTMDMVKQQQADDAAAEASYKSGKPPPLNRPLPFLCNLTVGTRCISGFSVAELRGRTDDESIQMVEMSERVIDQLEESIRMQAPDGDEFFLEEICDDGLLAEMLDKDKKDRPRKTLYEEDSDFAGGFVM